MNRIGVDLGGTKTEAVLLCGNDPRTAVVRRRRRVATPAGYDGIVETIAGLVSDVRGEAGGGARCTVGVCTPGIVSGQTGLVQNSNTRCLVGRPLQRDLEARLGQAIAVENDANCFAVAEATMGAGREFGTVFGVIMGTGVGGGIVIDGRVRRGRTRIAGEWGHHRLHPDGRRCYCGGRGCVETCISGPALEQRWEDLTGRRQSLEEIVSGADTAAGAGAMEGAARWRREFIDDFGAALANVIDILDPDAVVLGGGVSNVPFLYDEGKDAVHGRVFSDEADTPILQNMLGDSAGVFGAAMLWDGAGGL